MFVKDKEFDEACRAVHEFADKQIDAALKYVQSSDTKINSMVAGMEKPDRFVFLHELAKETDDRIVLRDQILNVLNAGHESAAIVTSRALFLLSRQRDIWRKLRAEVLKAGPGKPNYDQLKSMKYLRYVINESPYFLSNSTGEKNYLHFSTALRVYPLVPTNQRMALRDTILPRGGGVDGRSPVLVKKGSFFFTSSYALHHDKGIWGEDADEFKPEIWETVRQGWDYQAFGGFVLLSQLFNFLSHLNIVAKRLLSLLSQFLQVSSSRYYALFRDFSHLLSKISGLTSLCALLAELAYAQAKR